MAPPATSSWFPTIPHPARPRPLVRPSAVPTFRIPWRIKESLERGVHLIKYEITVLFVRVTVIATDKTGYIMKLFAYDESIVTVTLTIISGGEVEEDDEERADVERYTQLLDFFEFIPFRYVVNLPIELLRDHCLIDRLVVHVLYCIETRRDYMIDLEDLKINFSTVLSKKFESRKLKGRPPIQVERFCVEFDGADITDELVIEPFFDHMEARDLHFELSRDLSTVQKLRFRRLYQSEVFKLAFTVTIGDGFRIVLKEFNWQAPFKLRFTVNSLTFHKLAELLEEWREHILFKLKRVRVLDHRWDYRHLCRFFSCYPDECVVRDGSSSIYEQRLRVQLDGSEIVVRRYYHRYRNND